MLLNINYINYIDVKFYSAIKIKFYICKTYERIIIIIIMEAKTKEIVLKPR